MRPLILLGRHRTPNRLLITSLLLATVSGLLGCGGATGRSSATRGPGPEVTFATGEEVLQAVRNSNGNAVLVNIWATWCVPCIEEMPELLRLRKDYQGRGLELILVSADFDTQLPAAREFLGKQGVDFPSYIKSGKDMPFINTLHPDWTGALPASLLYDGDGTLRHFWEGKVTYATLEEKVQQILQDAQPPSNKEASL